MKHPFDALAGEYAQLLAACVVTRADEAQRAAARLMRDVGVYRDVANATGVPALWLMATNERESGGRLDRYLGNGERLDRVTRLVPKGRGPFRDWTEGAIDALRLDAIDKVNDWTWPRACFAWERWNGFGYRDYHELPSPYLWGGTNIQRPGKYVADGHFDPDAIDQQLGTIAVARALVALDPSLDLRGLPAPSAQLSDAAPMPTRGASYSVLWIQKALNTLGYGPLTQDASYGRLTRAAVIAFQRDRGLTVDGFVGPETGGALAAALKQLQG